MERRQGEGGEMEYYKTSNHQTRRVRRWPSLLTAVVGHKYSVAGLWLPHSGYGATWRCVRRLEHLKLFAWRQCWLNMFAPPIASVKKSHGISIISLLFAVILASLPFRVNALPICAPDDEGHSTDTVIKFFTNSAAADTATLADIDAGYNGTYFADAPYLWHAGEGSCGQGFNCNSAGFTKQKCRRSSSGIIVSYILNVFYKWQLSGQCPSGFTPDATGACLKYEKMLGLLDRPGLCPVGNPCNSATGNKHQAEEDYRSADGTLLYTRYYNSALNADIGTGVNWQATHHKCLAVPEFLVQVHRPDGKSELFVCSSTPCNGDGDTSLILVKDPTRLHPHPPQRG